MSLHLQYVHVCSNLCVMHEACAVAGWCDQEYDSELINAGNWDRQTCVGFTDQCRIYYIKINCRVEIKYNFKGHLSQFILLLRPRKWLKCQVQLIVLVDREWGLYISTCSMLVINLLEKDYLLSNHNDDFAWFCTMDLSCM